MKLLDWLRAALVKPDWEKVLTPRAKQVLALSRRAAAEQRWKQVEVEHLLAGILRLNQGLAVLMLKNTGLEPGDLRANLERAGVMGTASTEAIKMPFHSSVKTCLALSWAEAKRLGKAYCGTEHILLGILRCGKEVTIKMLGAHGLTLERAREMVNTIQAEETIKNSR